MDKKLYIITNSGSVVSIFDNKEERSKEFTKLVEEEKKYSCTHYYYGVRDMTRGEYVCDQLCRSTSRNIDWCSGGNKKLGLDEDEYFKYLMKNDCKKCPFKEYSPWMKEDKG